MSLDPTTAISALKWVGTLVFKEGTFLYQVPDEIRSLIRDLQHMLLFLLEVDEHREDTDDGQLRIFAHEMRQLAFRCEDVIQHYLINFQPKIEKKNFLAKLFCLCSHSYPIYKIRSEVESIQEDVRAANRRLQTFQTATQSTLDGQGQNAAASKYERLKDMPGRAIGFKDKFVVGIDRDIRNMVDRLVNGHQLPGDDDDDQSRFLAIVGTGGAGKTTLARQLYSHPEVTETFKPIVMITVSKEWSARFILIEMIRQTIGLRDEDWNSIEKLSTPALASKLRNFLRPKRYLIIIDDVWEKTPWDEISIAFPETDDDNGGSSSKILFTTRIDDLASSIDQRSFIHKPNPLTPDKRYDLLHKIAIEGRTSKNIELFESLAREMLEKCSGIPLAVVSLAGILSTKNELDQWERVKNSLTPTILKGKGTGKYGIVEHMLALSYYDLPSYIRPCLLQLTVFREDEVIRVGMVIRMWVAEGLITESDRQHWQETLEEVGLRFLDELTRRCLLVIVRRNRRGKLKEFRLHDLVRDLCVQKAKEQCFSKVISSLEYQRTGGAERRIETRRVSVHLIRQRRVGNPTDYHAIDIGTPSEPSLRSLILLGEFENQDLILTRVLRSGKLHEEFKFIKVLCLRGVGKVVLPQEIGTLTHLKYFDLKGSKMDPLPESFTSLKNLSTLDLRVRNKGSSDEIKENFFEKMGQLEHVYLSPDNFSITGTQRTAIGVKNSKNLKDLFGIRGGKWMVDELPALKHLGRLSVWDVSSSQQMEAILQCPSMERLHQLVMKCNLLSRMTIDLRQLEQCAQLRKQELTHVHVKEEEGLNETIRFFQNLESLSLERTGLKRQSSISAIGKLPSLKCLRLGYHSYLEEKLVFERNSFLQLEELHLVQLETLVDWRIGTESTDGGDSELVLLPCLRKMSILYCGALSSLPAEFQHVSTLQELEIKESEGVRQRIENGSGEDYYIVQHIPSLKIH